MGLDKMDCTFSIVKSHRPVVRNCIYDILHPGMDRSLCRPNMSSDNGNILGHILIDSCHELCVFLVGSIIWELLKSRVINRFPDKFIEEPALLWDPWTLGIKVILSRNNFRACCLGIWIQVHPVRHISHGISRTCYCHWDPVVTESHSDISDDNTVIDIKAKTGSGLVLTDLDILYA